MDYLVIALRLVHILGGMFWVGSSIVFFFFISPAIAANAEAGQKIMAHLVTKARISTGIAISAILTVVAGGWLYAIDSQAFTSGWERSGPGIGFSIGGIFALIGLVFGIIVGRNTNVLGSLASEIHGKPTPDQLNRIQAAQKQLSFAGPISSTCVILALICMATARYWVF